MSSKPHTPDCPVCGSAPLRLHAPGCTYEEALRDALMANAASDGVDWLIRIECELSAAFSRTPVASWEAEHYYGGLMLIRRLKDEAAKTYETQRLLCEELLKHVTHGGSQHEMLIKVYQSPYSPASASAHFVLAEKPRQSRGGPLSLATVRRLIEKGALIEHERLDKWRTTYRLSHPAIEALSAA